MASELLIRAGFNDHQLAADLLTPGPRRLVAGRPLIGRLVIDAHVAASHPQFADIASSSGTPLLIDPITPLLQGTLASSDPWAQLPFGVAAPLSVGEVADPGHRRTLAHQVVEFELDHGATAVIPPYLYALSPQDPAFRANLALLEETADYLEGQGIKVPLLPIVCCQLHGFAGPANWDAGLGAYSRLARDVGVTAVGLLLSPVGQPNDSYNKVMSLMLLARHVRDTGLKVIAWRQGVYGPALVAAGIDGYETGMGTREQADVQGSVRARAPRNGKGKSFAGGPGIFLQPFGRSYSTRVARVLLGEASFRAKVICDDPSCCPNGAQSMLADRRGHAVRARARLLAELESMPHSSWRLVEVGRQAAVGLTLAAQAEKLLQSTFSAEPKAARLPAGWLDALAQAATHLSQPEPNIRLA